MVHFNEEQQAIISAIREAYETDGFSTAAMVGEKYNLPTEYCGGCDTQVPVFSGEHECLVCGQDTSKRDPNDEIIPLENDDL